MLAVRVCSNYLVIRDVCGKASYLARDAKALDDGDELGKVVAPSQPASMCCVNIKGARGLARCRECVDSVHNPLLISCLSGSVAAVRVAEVCREVWE